MNCKCCGKFIFLQQMESDNLKPSFTHVMGGTVIDGIEWTCRSCNLIKSNVLSKYLVYSTAGLIGLISIILFLPIIFIYKIGEYVYSCKKDVNKECCNMIETQTN